MTFNEYQLQAAKTNIYPSYSMAQCLTLGLCSEAGEVAGKRKKAIRDGAIDYDAIAQELGDCLWYISELARHYGYTLDEVAELNLQKLSSRAKRGTIHGEGDNR